MDGGGASCATLAALTTQPPPFPSSPPAAGLTRLPSAPPSSWLTWKGETLLCLIIKGFLLLCHTGWMELALLRGSRRRNREEADQKGEIHREAFTLSRRDVRLDWEDGGGLFLSFSSPLLLLPKAPGLAARWLHRSHYSFSQLSKVGGGTTSTSENNTLWFAAALWNRAAEGKKKTTKTRGVGNTWPWTCQRWNE